MEDPEAQGDLEGITGGPVDLGDTTGALVGRAGRDITEGLGEGSGSE